MLHIVESGPVDAHVVVIVHGSMDRARSFTKVAAALDDDFRVVLYDRRGYGRSAAVGGPFGMDAQVADLVAVLAGRRAVVIGHSFGGNIALAAAERHPELAAAIGVFESPMPWEPWWPPDTVGGQAIAIGLADGPAAAAEGFLRKMLGDEQWERLPAATRAARRAEGEALLGELVELGDAPPYDPAGVVVPVVSGGGGGSKGHHARSTEATAAAFPGTETVIIPGATHGAHLTHPVEFAAFVRVSASYAQWP